jgi:hypothetical protein
MGDGVKKARKRTRGAAEPGSADPPRPPTVLVALRVPQALADRLDALTRELSTPWHEMKRSELARTALERGLDALEQAAADRRKSE